MIEYDLDDPTVEGSGAVDLESMGHYGDSGSGALLVEGALEKRDHAKSWTCKI